VTAMRGPGMQRALLAVGGSGAAMLLLVSLYTSAVCACASVAENVLVKLPWRMDREFLQKAADLRFPRGTGEAGLIEQLGVKRYAQYCLQGRGGAALVCVLPHEVNFWRDTHVQLAFAFDAERRIAAVRAEPIVRYAWF